MTEGGNSPRATPETQKATGGGPNHRKCSAVLVIGGTDSSGGAGLAADIRTAAAHAVDARLAVTAVTAQSDARVGDVETMPPALVAEQVAMALEDGRVSAVKIGMLGNEAIVAAVVDALSRFGGPIVLDPVIAASSGGQLLSEAGIATMTGRLLPITALVTPNLPELDILSGLISVPPGADTDRKAHALLNAGAGAVLVKGGHGEGRDAVDILYRTGRSPIRFASPRIAATLRGTGCALATAIACRLASGDTLEAACEGAKAFVAGLLKGRADLTKSG
ncbi:bifunctional hydroxymethylpyrimidine kinase/phosphomethylpyrimidine kinase [Jiella pacifica]|uniref:hydroxymethylpyrimidine kinase n=1 Tax=Jiella pacifica TaxID=2696469 RepID=A0A6N9T2L5_9HYPH|nr:bifunctional hydroxymethylpyrimidine kinase/phosphomethylpyrimidine kinase [Jiella pacifica]NDW04286.1 bifunctional hydroxymethylpyrimidine kinase/phosphomethylpyrimidine kinase [Jiella pacifica]